MTCSPRIGDNCWFGFPCSPAGAVSKPAEAVCSADGIDEARRA
jgi:hypothetical protein